MALVSLSWWRVHAGPFLGLTLMVCFNSRGVVLENLDRGLAAVTSESHLSLSNGVDGVTLLPSEVSSKRLLSRNWSRCAWDTLSELAHTLEMQATSTMAWGCS